MSHTTLVARAVAVTDNPGTAAVALAGPHVRGDTDVHIHTGKPTKPDFPSPGAIPIAGPEIGNSLTACCATSAGVAARPP
jgi:hypothetical protein